MLLFISQDRPQKQLITNFNTSHVTVYLDADKLIRRMRIFQYISCYCLSWFRRRANIKENNFNTSHVTVYPTRSERQIQQRAISIHLMLLFIEVEKMHEIPKIHFNTSHVTVYRPFHPLARLPYLFQYISCYCLSAEKTRLSDLFRDFNTSHVTVYLHWRLVESTWRIFQYISCYCLSPE